MAGGPIGQYLLAREQAFFDGVVADVFGYNAFQLGMPEVDLLRASRMPMRCRVGRDGAARCRGRFPGPCPSPATALTGAPAAHPGVHRLSPQILREVARVLRPEGPRHHRELQPWSLWGAARFFGVKRRYPWNGHFINLPG
jgi:hypothetical protein